VRVLCPGFRVRLCVGVLAIWVGLCYLDMYGLCNLHKDSCMSAPCLFTM